MVFIVTLGGVKDRIEEILELVEDRQYLIDIFSDDFFLLLIEIFFRVGVPVADDSCIVDGEQHRVQSRHNGIQVGIFRHHFLRQSQMLFVVQVYNEEDCAENQNVGGEQYDIDQADESHFVFDHILDFAFENIQFLNGGLIITFAGGKMLLFDVEIAFLISFLRSFLEFFDVFYQVFQAGFQLFQGGNEIFGFFQGIPDIFVEIFLLVAVQNLLQGVICTFEFETEIP